MTPKIIELKQVPVVLVELPHHPTQIIDGLDRTKIHYRNEVFGDWIAVKNIPEFDSILGIISDLTEEQFAECVKQGLGLYANYNETVEFGTAMRFEKASESFYSLLESEKVYTENPFEFPSTIDHKYYDSPYDGTGFYQELYSNDMTQWQEAQQRTIDPKRTVILLRK